MNKLVDCLVGKYFNFLLIYMEKLTDESNIKLLIWHYNYIEDNWLMSLVNSKNI